MGDDQTDSFRLSGQVVDEQKRPVAGVLVRLTPGTRTATSDANGAFAFDGLASRRYSLAAHKDDFYGGPTRVEGAEPVVVQLHRGATLVMHVVADGAPVAGATVGVGEMYTAVTSSDGVATIRGLSPAYHDAWVKAEGWAPALVYWFLHEDPGGVVERYVTLRPGARIEGVVVGPGDVPVANARLVLWRAAEGSFVGETSAGADGSWCIEALEAGRYRVDANSDDYCAGEMVLASDGQTPQRGVTVRVEPGAEVHGLAVDSAGAPVAGARITAWLYHASNKHGASDANGRFRIAGLPPGEYYVDAVTSSHASAAAHLQLERGKPVETRLVLEPARIAGIVVDEHGEPVVEAKVHATAHTGYLPYRPEASTDARGRFDLGPLPLGEYDLDAHWPRLHSGRNREMAVRVQTDSDVRLVVETPARITGRVVFDGAPLPYFGVSLIHERQIPATYAVGVRDADGRFVLHVEPGTWRIALLGPGTELRIVEDITAERGKVIDLGDVIMQRGQRIAGHVRDAAGAPVAGARVTIGFGTNLHDDTSRLRQWFEGVYETTTEHDGRYAFDGIGRFEWGFRPRVIAATHHAGASRVRLLPEGDTTIDFVLHGAGTIDGIVEGARGRHCFAAAVAEGEPEDARWSSVEHDGSFRFENLAPGDYVVSLTAPGNEPLASQKVVVASGSCTEVKISITSSLVRLTIRVPRGREHALRIERVDGVPVRSGSMILEGQVTYDELEPGEYRLTLDGTTWTPTVVTPDPHEQTIAL